MCLLCQEPNITWRAFSECREVDLVLRDGIKPALKDRILREAIYAA